MKRLLILATLLFTASAMAEMPKFLEGATVTVKLKNGKTFEYKSEKMAVVPRMNLGIASSELKDIKKKISEKKLVKNRKNRVYGLIGSGPTGDLDVSTNGSNYVISHDKGPVTGIGYQRKITEKFNMGIQVQSNKTTSLSLGLDF